MWAGWTNLKMYISKLHCFCILVFSVLREIHCVFTCAFTYWASLLITNAVLLNIPLSHSQFKRNQQNSTDKKAGNQTVAEWCNYFTTAFTLACLCYITFFFYLTVTQQRASTFNSERDIPCLSPIEIFVEGRKSHRPWADFVLQSLWSHLTFVFYRIFYFPFPLSDEGKRQETVEDPSLLWTFPTWRVHRYNSRTYYVLSWM